MIKTTNEKVSHYTDMFNLLLDIQSYLDRKNPLDKTELMFIDALDDIVNKVEATETEPYNPDKHFTQGYYCALATYVHTWGKDTVSDELYEACGSYTIEQLKDYEVDEYDIITLKDAGYFNGTN